MDCASPTMRDGRNVLDSKALKRYQFELIFNQGETTDVNDEEEEEQGAQTPPPNKDTTPPNNEGHHDREINNESPSSPFDPVIKVHREDSNYPDTPLEQPWNPYCSPAPESFEIEELPSPEIVSVNNQGSWGGGKKKAKRPGACYVGFAD